MPSIDESVEYRWARKIEDKAIAPNMYIPQLIQLVWAENRVSTLYSSSVQAQLSADWIRTCIWRNIRVFYFAGSSIFNWFIYGWHVENAILLFLHMFGGKNSEVKFVLIAFRSLHFRAKIPINPFKFTMTYLLHIPCFIFY